MQHIHDNVKFLRSVEKLFFLIPIMLISCATNDFNVETDFNQINEAKLKYQNLPADHRATRITIKTDSEPIYESEKGEYLICSIKELGFSITLPNGFSVITRSSHTIGIENESFGVSDVYKWLDSENLFLFGSADYSRKPSQNDVPFKFIMISMTKDEINTRSSLVDLKDDILKDLSEEGRHYKYDKLIKNNDFAILCFQRREGKEFIMCSNLYVFIYNGMRIQIEIILQDISINEQKSLVDRILEGLNINVI